MWLVSARADAGDDRAQRRWCPRITADNSGLGKRLDTGRLLGLTLQDARRLAAEYHCGVQAVPEDRHDLDDSLIDDEGLIQVTTSDGAVRQILAG